MVVVICRVVTNPLRLSSQAHPRSSRVLRLDVIGPNFIAVQSPSARPPTGDACLGREV